MIHHIDGPAGRIEALVDDPGALCTTGDVVADPARPPMRLRAVVVLGHPHPLYGGTMHTRAVFQAAKAFCRMGCAVVRFNFRGVGTSEGTFDEGRGEALDFASVVGFAAARYPGVEIWAAGLSFGSWVAMTAGAADGRVSLLLGLSAPIALYDWSAVAASAKPRLFIHGERDDVCPLADLRRYYAGLDEPKDLVVIETADHLFSGHITEMGDAIEQLLGGLPW